MDTKSVFGERIKQLRGSMKQEEFGKLLGVSRGAISYYENGERAADIEILKKICAAFGVSADWLIGNTDVKSADTSIADFVNMTGLSENSIELLRRFSMYAFTDILETIDVLIGQGDITPSILDKRCGEITLGRGVSAMEELRDSCCPPVLLAIRRYIFPFGDDIQKGESEEERKARYVEGRVNSERQLLGAWIENPTNEEKVRLVISDFYERGKAHEPKKEPDELLSEIYKQLKDLWSALNPKGGE